MVHERSLFVLENVKAGSLCGALDLCNIEMIPCGLHSGAVRARFL